MTGTTVESTPKTDEGKKILKLSLQELAPAKLHDWNAVSSQIASYFRQLLESKQIETVAYVELPSIFEFSDFFNCCEMDVFDALYELKLQAYWYEIHKVDGFINLCDPLLRKLINTRRWRGFPKMRPESWDCLRQIKAHQQHLEILPGLCAS